MPEGLRLIVSERDTKVMAAIVDRVRLFVLYFDHVGSASSTDWDDVVINPVSLLPKVVSPSKVGKSQDNIEADANSNDDSDVSEFVDSDYELGEDDDALFADNVDGDVRDGGVGRTKKRGKEPSRQLVQHMWENNWLCMVIVIVNKTSLMKMCCSCLTQTVNPIQV